MSHNNLPSRNRLIRSGAALAAGVAAATFALNACTADRPVDPAPTIPVATAYETPEVPSPTVDPEQQNQDELDSYIASPERNHTIEGVVNRLGARIIKHGPSKIGYFDFYNTQTKKWKYDHNKGWGYFQHNPGYGGSKYQVSVGAYQTANGHIDPAKGIQELSVDIQGTNSFIEFTGPTALKKFLGSKVGADKGWTVAIVNMDKIKTEKDGRDAWEKVDGTGYQTDPNSVPDAAAAKAIDEKALALAEKAVDKLLG